MPTVGTDCQLILDAVGYWIEPASYKVERPRVARADLTGVAASPVGPGAGAGERYVDRGPGKRLWTFTIVAFNAMTDYSGNPLGVTVGQTIHDSIQTSYNKVNTPLAFTDPVGAVWSVRFDDLVEELADIRGQADSNHPQYYLHVTLVEA